MVRENVLVTGYRGFLGQSLMTRLKTSGYGGCIGVGKNDDIAENFNYPPDVIFHLASAGSKKNDYSEDEIVITNITETWRLLKTMRDIPYRALINFSSSSVYGIKDHPMREDDNLAPNFLYASTKAATEMLCRNEAVEHGKPIVNARLFTIYGPGMQETKLIPVLFDRIKNGKEIQIVDGEHDFLYIDDCLEALNVLVDNAGQLAGTAVNLGTGIATTNKEIVEHIEDIVGKKAIFSKKPFEHNHTSVDSPVWRANINTLKTYGWKPKVSVREGLERMYESM